MNRRPAHIVILVAFFLAACVPIPPESPQAVDKEVKAGLSDLASVLAKSDGAETPEEYAVLLDKITDCFQAGDDEVGELEDADVSPSETLAITIWAVGLMGMISQFQLIFDSPDSSDNGETTAYEYLAGALAVCEQSE